WTIVDFFFQAEDGIRDFHVTGVQTCALPIYRYENGEPVISEDDVLIPIAGILDILDYYAFVRTSGYLPGPNDVYVSMSQIRKYEIGRASCRERMEICEAGGSVRRKERRDERA